MKYRLSEDFRRKYKKQNIRVKKLIDEALKKFYKNHKDLVLENHPLERKYSGYRSINIRDYKNDLRAIFEEIEIGDVILAYFHFFGTHNELYKEKLVLERVKKKLVND